MFYQKWKYANRLQSIAVQLFLSFVLCMIIPILIGGYISYQRSAHLIEQQVSNVASLTISQMQDKLDFMNQDLEDISMAVLYNTKIQEYLEPDPKLTIYERRQLFNEAAEIISTIMTNSNESMDIYIFDVNKQNTLFSSANETADDLWYSHWYRDIVQADGRPVWFGFNETSYLQESKAGVPVYALGRAVKNVHENKIVGVMLIEIKGGNLSRDLDQVKFGNTGYTSIIDDSNRYIYHKDPALYGTQAEYNIPGQKTEIVQDGEKLVIIPAQLSNGWRVVGTVPLDELVQGTIPIRNLTVIISCLSVLWALGIGFYISRKVGRPINNLSKLMKKGEMGDLSVRADFEDRNEIGQLSRSFNKMIIKINELIYQIGEEESEKKKAEIRALRYQINPHFLFNTLNSIRWMAKLNQTENVSMSISLFASLLEATIERKGMFIKLEEDLEILRKYVGLQQYRYAHRVILQIDCPTSLKQVVIPRMLLQPIVENAVFHGIAPKDEDGLITIQIRDQRDDISVVITDDGVGMPEQKLSSLRSPQAGQSGRMTRIGLYHVEQIIKLYYGERYGVIVESMEGQGTTIKLTLSKSKGVKHYE